MKKTVMVLICLIMTFLFVSCGAGSKSGETQNAKDLLEPLEYFESIDITGQTAKRIYNNFGAFKYVEYYNGGSYYSVEKSDFIIAFSNLSVQYAEEELNENIEESSIKCRAMNGEVSTIFGIKDDINIYALGEKLGINFEHSDDSAGDGVSAWSGIRTINGNEYHVCFYCSKETIEPDTRCEVINKSVFDFTEEQ